MQLIRQGLNGGKTLRRMWRDQPLNDRYDVVIIGGGIHGLAACLTISSYHARRVSLSSCLRIISYQTR